MSLKSSKKTEANTWELEVAVTGEEFKAAILKVYNRQKSRITIPGFRKGKATLSLIEGRYGKDYFYNDAIEMLYPDMVSEAIKEAGIKPIDDPTPEIKEIGEDGVLLLLTVTVKPEEVEIGEYKALKAEKEEVAVSDDEADAEIERMRDRNARTVTVEDRAAANGDIAVIDFEGFVDGVAFDGGKGENHNLTLGSGQFIPGFEEQIEGHVSGDEFDVNVTFPEEYTPELAGKQAVFKCKLNEIKVRELPALDDDFAKDVSEYDTVDALKQSIVDGILKEKTERAEDAFRGKLLEQVAESVKAEIPEVMFTKRAEDNKANFANRISQQGIDLETYFMYTGINPEQFEKDMYDQAVRQVKLQLALEKVAELEKIEVTDEEVDAEYTRLGEQYHMDVERIKGLVAAEDIKEDLVREKASKVILDTAVAVKPEDKSEDKPAKKPAAKKPAAKKAAVKKPAAEDAEVAEEPAAQEEKKPAKKPAAKKPAAKKETETKTEAE